MGVYDTKFFQECDILQMHILEGLYGFKV
jgi:hypothetical protein